MPVALQAHPEDLLEPRPPNPEYLALCLELQGRPQDDYELCTPVMLRIAAVWRGPGSWEERTLATMEAANREAPGLWVAITSAVVEYHAFQETRFRIHVEREQAAIAACTDSRIAEARRKRLERESIDYVTGRGPFSTHLFDYDDEQA